MKIFALEDRDIQACLDIYNHYIVNTCFTLEETALSLEAFTKRIHAITQTYPFVVAKNDQDEVLGYAYLSVFNERSAYRRTADFSVYVHKDHLHEHLGSALLAHIETLAKKQGITNLISIITNVNKRSIAFHQKMGFVQVAHLLQVAYKMNQLIDSYYYQKLLD